MKRFNKQNLQDYLNHHIAKLEKEFGFDPNNGYDQVKQSDLHRVMAYGEYEALQNIYDAVEYKCLQGDLWHQKTNTSKEILNNLLKAHLREQIRKFNIKIFELDLKF